MAKKIELNGKVYTYGDTSHMNAIQAAHIRGELDVYTPISDKIPSIAEQWKQAYNRSNNNNGQRPRSR